MMNARVYLSQWSVPRVVFLFLVWVSSVPVFAQVLLTGKSEGMNYELEQVIEGLSVPWGMAFLSPSEIIFTERNGAVKLLVLSEVTQTSAEESDQSSARVIRLSGYPAVKVVGQGGMLDVAVPDDFIAGGWIYFTYSKGGKDNAVTVLARAKRKGEQLVDWVELLESRSATDTGRHFGSRIAFDRSGHVFFTIGDRGVRPNSQNLLNHAGTVIRLKRNGSIPADNPFINVPKSLPEIWSYGHRNPQGIFYDNENHRLWAIEHGPRGGDEINLIEPGKNYGWPVISYGKEYWGPVHVGDGTHKQGMEQPIKYYVPSIAPSSLILYSGKAFPQWKGNLFAGALKLTHLNRVSLGANGNALGEERLLSSLKERVRAVIEGPEGWLYLSTDSGRILRLRPRRPI